MKKMPTVFERDWDGDRSRVINQVHRDCQWVIDGEGVATRKIDGTCCMVRDGKLYKRREIKDCIDLPPGFELVGLDNETGKAVGWVQVGDGPEDRWHREASGGFEDGTYELVGPKIQGNAEGYHTHWLVKHGEGIAGQFSEPVPRTFDGLREWLANRDIEGIVFHHPDGSMAKIKLKDFGLKRQKIDIATVKI